MPRANQYTTRPHIYITMYLIVRLFITRDYKLALRPLCFFLCFRWARALDLGLTMCFFLPSACIRLLPISEKKQSISGDKKNIPKKNKFISRDKKYFSSYVFLLVFFVALISLPFFKLGQKCFFISSPSLTFPDICPMFSIISLPSLTFPKIGSMCFSS